MTSGPTVSSGMTQISLLSLSLTIMVNAALHLELLGRPSRTVKALGALGLAVSLAGVVVALVSRGL